MVFACVGRCCVLAWVVAPCLVVLSVQECHCTLILVWFLFCLVADGPPELLFFGFINWLCSCYMLFFLYSDVLRFSPYFFVCVYMCVCVCLYIQKNS